MTDWRLTRTFPSPQGAIHWDSIGEGSPVVLIHGTPASSFLWRKVVPRLAERHRVYYFDWPGYGASERFAGQNVSWDEQARQLVALFDHMGVERPAVVAHDIGPLLLLRAHLLEGLSVGSMVLADAAVVPPFVSGFSAYARDHIGVFREIPVHIAEAMIRAHLATTVSTPMADEVMAGYMAPWRGPEGVAAYWRAVQAYDENLAHPVAERLGEIDRPTLVLWGAEDAWEPVHKADELAARIPDAVQERIPAAGHFAPEDQPQAFSEAVERFLAGG